MLTVVRSALKKLFEQPPAGYRQGATLERALGDLRDRLTVVARNSSAHAHLRSLDGSLKCEIHERVEKHFLLHIVAVELFLTVPAVAVPFGRMEIRNTGVLFRKGIVCNVPTRFRAGLQGIKELLEYDSSLLAALLKLDFRSCEIVGTKDGWQIRLEPYGASEVVSRLPSFRRYIRLGREQADSLVTALNALQRVLHGPMPV